jgi:hypothetical protein
MDLETLAECRQIFAYKRVVPNYPMNSEWVHPEHREIHDWLTHWGRWLQTARTPSHCDSAEWQYRSPQCWDERNPKPQAPNESHAATIESLMRITPKLSRKLLKLKYVYRAEPSWIAKRLRFPVKHYPQQLYAARQIVLNLTRHKLASTMHGRFHNLSLSDFVEISP